VEGRGTDRPIKWGRMVEEVKKRVRECKCVCGGCGRDDGDCFGWNNFSDAPSLINARSMQQERSAIRKEMISEKVLCKCMPSQRGVMLEAAAHNDANALLD
jgi:hypothetical protein